MATLQSTRAEDLLETAAPGGALDPEPLLGVWINTNPEPRGMVRVVLGRRGAALTVRVFGAGSPVPIDWGEVEGEVFAKDVKSREAMAFAARYDFGFLRVDFQANVKQGVLVVASFNEFRDASGRASYFTREFFYR